MSESQLIIWAIYVVEMAQAEDESQLYVAKAFLRGAWTGGEIVGHDLEALRAKMQQMGLVKLAPMPGDEPNLIETWL